MKIGIIILAGVKGERFHGKKQDLEFYGKPLWKHVYDTAVESICEQNIVIVGKDVPRVCLKTTFYPLICHKFAEITAR